MERKLEQFILAAEALTDIHNQNKNPVILRLTASDTTKSLVFYCAYKSPKFVVLPKDVVWLDLDPSSKTYRSAYKRTAYDVSNPANDKWERLYFYDASMADQSYDAKDLEVVSITPPSPASKLTHGIGYLSSTDLKAEVVVEGDSRLSDNRPPKTHSHAEKPATIIGYRVEGVDAAQFFPIADQQTPALKQVLKFSNNQYVWERITESDLTGGVV